MKYGRIDLPLEQILELKEQEPTHYNFKSKVGEIFGNLQVMFYAGRDSRDTVMYVCECFCGNYTLVNGSNLRKDKLKVTSCGCFRDALKKTIPEDVIKSRIEQVYSLTEYEVVNPNGGGFDHVWDFCCPTHGNFSTTYGLVVGRGTQCPSCAVSGYKTTEPGFFYLNAVYSEDCLVAIKFGITNKSVEQRLKQIEAKTEFKLENIFHKHFENGRDALLLENLFSKTFGKKFLNKTQMPCGFTETIDPALLQQALDWLIN